MSEHLIIREAGTTVVGRILVEGSRMRVERLDRAADIYVCIGYYEDLRNPDDLKTRNRKIQEIDNLFEDWVRAAGQLESPSEIKANWHHREETPLEFRRPNSDQSGVLHFDYRGVKIAKVYKTKEYTGHWVSLL